MTADARTPDPLPPWRQPDEPAGATDGDAGREGTGHDQPRDPDATTARHAVVRPSPVPPPPPPPADPPRTTAGDTDGRVAGGTDAAAGSGGATAAEETVAVPHASATDGTAAPRPPRAPWAPDEDDDAAPLPVMGTPTRATEPGLFPDPDPPRSASVGRHVLGVLLGIVLAPLVAAALVGGQGRVLAVGTGAPDVLGIAVLAAGALLAAAVVALATWSAAVPVTAGLLLAAAGGFALVAPGIARTQVLDAVAWGTWRPTVLESLVAATSGTVLVAGLLVLVAGLTAAATRRRGHTLGAFRERHHPTGPARRADEPRR